MRLHLVYIIAMLVCENRKGSPTKWMNEFEFAMQKWKFNDVIAVALYSLLNILVSYFKVAILAGIKFSDFSE